MALSRRITLATLGAAVLAAAVFTYLGAQKTEKTVRIGITPFQDTVLPVVADKLGWYKESGYKVQFVDVGWTDVPLALGSGSVDVVLYSSESLQPALPALAGGGKDVIFYAPLYAFNGAAIMVHGNSGYRTLSSLAGLTQAEVDNKVRDVIGQLKGKKVGVTEGTIAETVVRNAIAKAGMSPTDVELVHARYEDNLAAFLAGRIDAFVGGVTERTRARQAGAIELLVGSAVSDPPMVGLVTTRSFAEKNPKVMQSLIDNFYRTVRYMDEDLRGRAHLATDYLKGKASVDYTPDEYAFAWSFQYFPKTRQEAIGAFLSQNSPYYWRRNWQNQNDFLIKTGKIKEPVPFDTFWGEQALRPR